MTNKKAKTETFKSMDSWREFYFPKEVSNERINELSASSEELGITLANDAIDQHIKRSRATS